ncbi:MAG: diguanylate cyclase [Gallionellaceae bacterium]|nr:diguanylate cyclase [Gallionellaceae bacterium]
MHKNDVEALNYFLFTLKWILAVTKRYPGNVHFGLVHIFMGNSYKLGNNYGAQEASCKLDECSAALRNVFRNTDIVARDGMDYWILAPYTPANENITHKVMGILEEASRNGLDITDSNIAVFSLPLKDFPYEEDKYSVLNYLHDIKSMCGFKKACKLLCESKNCLKVEGAIRAQP